MEKYYIGIDLGGTNIKGAIFRDKYEIIIEKPKDTEAKKGSEQVLNNIIN